MITDLIWPAVNFSLLLFVLYSLLKKPVKAMVQNRHQTIRQELYEVREKLRSAQEKFDDFSSKLKVLNNEVESIKDQAKRDAESMRTKIVSNAKEQSSSLVGEARNQAQRRFGDLKRELQAELGVRVVGEAEAILKKKLTGADRARIMKEFSAQVGGMR